MTEPSNTRPRNWFERFLPRSSSNAVFIFTMTCYTFTIEYLNGRLSRLFGFWRTSHVKHLSSTPMVPLLISPVVDSLVVIGLIELARRLKFNIAIQIAVAVLVSCFLIPSTALVGAVSGSGVSHRRWRLHLLATGRFVHCSGDNHSVAFPLQRGCLHRRNIRMAAPVSYVRPGNPFAKNEH